MHTKLIRNLKRGDRIRISDYTIPAKPRTAVVTVSAVQETRRGFATGQRRWEVIGDYPWWWPFPVTGYSKDRIEVLN